MPLIRPSRDEDVAAITAIYNHHVLHGTGTFEIDPPSASDMATRRADVLGKGLPYLVVEEEGQVLGFAYGNWFKPRPAYRFSAENSIYLAPGVAGRGLLVQPWQVIPFSSEDGTGKEELLNKIEQVCYAEEEQDDAAGEPTPPIED